MRGTTGKAPQPVSKEAPMTAEAVKAYCTIGGSQVKARPAVGWEAITPKPQSRPDPVIKALQAMNEAWDEYIWHIDAGADHGTIDALWWDYDRAKAAYYEQAEAAEAEYMALYSPEAALSEVGS